MRSVFPEQPFMDPQFSHYALDHLPVRILVLDSHIPKKDYGILCEERKQWLTARLEEDRKKPTMIFLHHFPIDVQEPIFSTINLRNGNDLKQIISASPNVRGIYCGHYHHAGASVFGRALCWISPSTAPSHILEGDKCIGLNLTYPAYSVHEFINGNFMSQIVSVAPTLCP
ncbi:MAG: hypothetical protein A3K20_02530 [Alphaproteobacteria bacterium GWA1_45_9]|nr:MAG: hypothetical protein A2065_01090 [Alphaproteobacteria bacterium GWB1_45_5]OFW76369.1 MAG: hypothetical protein A3K20_02530 [Alphaproteobacteria bacterium GWA1_45_9]